MGDLNCDLSPGLPQVKQLQSFCGHYNLSQIVSSRTRVTQNSVSLINICATSCPDCFTSIKASPCGLSDHHVVTMQLYARGSIGSRRSHRIVRSRDYRKLDVEKIADVLTKEEWNKVVSFKDVNDCVECFNLTVSGVMDIVIPVKLKRVKQSVPPWTLLLKPMMQGFNVRELTRQHLR